METLVNKLLGVFNMNNVFETLLGAIVLCVAIGFIYFAYNSSDRVFKSDSYHINAKFERADGITVGSEVRVGGIKIGAVTAESLEHETYLALIKMAVSNKIKLPQDSSAQIIGDGLLGNKYIAIIPGGEDDMLNNEDYIKYTQSTVNLESLIGKFIFSTVEKNTNNVN